MVNLGKNNKRKERVVRGGWLAGPSYSSYWNDFPVRNSLVAHLYSKSHHSHTQPTGTSDSFVEVGCEVMRVSCLHCSVFQHRARMEMCLPGKSCFQPTRQRAQRAAQPGHLQLSTEASAFLRTRAVWDADLWQDLCVPEGRRAVENLTEARKSSNP